MSEKRRKRRQWGNGSIARAANGTWKIRWCEAGKRKTRGGLRSRDDAERVLAKVLGDIAQGRSGLPADPAIIPKLSELAPDYFERRKRTHRAGFEDASRWRKHVAPYFEHLRPAQVDAARMRAFIEAKLAQKANPATVRIYIALLSALFADLCERGIAQSNPARGLPRSTMRRIYLALPEPLNVAYAIGALAGLRTGEVFALRWQHVDLATRRAHVRECVRGPLKDKDSRMVPILDALAPILAAWKLKTGGEGLVIPPLRCDGEKIDKHTPGISLRAALKQLGLTRAGLGWYEATRHTFASQWVMAGASIEKLKEILGHYSVVMTERYAHLRPDLFPASDLGTIRVDLSSAGAEVVQLRLKTGSSRRKAPAKGPEAKENGQSRPCKPGPVSPPRRRGGGGGHSSRTRVAAGLERAYPGARRATVAARSGAPLFALAPGGACRAAAVTGGAVRSCRTVSPLPAFRPAVCSLWRCPASRLGWQLTSTLPCGARTFLPRVIAPASARAAPTGRECNTAPVRKKLRRSILQLFVDRAVRHLVRELILFARDVDQHVVVERPQQRDRLFVEATEHFVPHRVLPLELADEQLAVRPHFDLAGAQLAGAAQSQEEPLVLRDVVRLLAEKAPQPGQHPAFAVQDHRAGPGRAGVAPRRPVGEDPHTPHLSR